MKSTASTTRTSAPVERNARHDWWRKRLPLGIVILLGAAIIAGLWPKAIPVDTVVISSGPLTTSVLEEGKTRIRHRHTVSAPVGGFLNRVELRAGDPIQAGQTVLATIQPQVASFLDPRTRAEAEARLRSAEAAAMQRGAQLERARASLQLAEKEFKRANDLKRSGAIAGREFDTAESQANVLARELRAAEFAQQVGEFERAQAEAALMQTDNAGSEKAAPLVITAPVSGFVLNVQEESARVLLPGAPIMEVGDPTDLETEIELLSSDAVGVIPGAEVSIERWGGDAPLRGKVTTVEPGAFTKISALGVEEQRVKVRVDFAEPFPPGRTLGDRYRVEARIVTWSSPNVLQIPTGALFRHGDQWMTFLVNGGKAHAAKIAIGHNSGIAAEILSGAQKGDTVILHPPDPVTDGARVAPRKSSAR